MRATHLLIPGHIEPDGGVKCCICGCATTKDRIGKDYFGDIFRDYREMQCRLSPYICSMCALSLKDVPGGVVHYIDGTEKTPKSDKRGLGWRFFSWVLVQGEAPIGATKAHTKELRADESAKRCRRVRVFGYETAFSFAPLAYMKVKDIFAYLHENALPVHPVYAMTCGGRYDRYRLRVSAIGNPEGRGVGRLKWEKEYYGDVLNRMGKTLWLRKYEL